MANETGSLNVELGLNSRDFKNGISQANRQMKLLQTEFKATEEEMKNSSDEMGKLRTKTNYLNSSMDVQKNKIAILQAEHRRAVEAQGANSAAAQNLQIKINQATQTLNRMGNELKDTERNLSILEGGITGLENNVEELTKTIDKHKDKLKDLENEHDRVVQAQGENSEEAQRLKNEIEQVTTELNQYQEELRDTDRQLTDLRESTNDAENNLNNLSDNFNNSGENAKEATKNFEKFGGYLKAGFVAAVAVAVAALVGLGVHMFNVGDEFKKASNTMSSQTGKVGKDLQELQGVMKNLYSQNYGESWEDLANRISIVQQNSKRLGVESPQDIEKLTKSAIILSDAFEFETLESIKAVSSLVQAFGIDAEYAFDLIAKGAQEGLNVSDDLIDTVNEYAMQFDALGFSVEEMFSMLKNGAESGTFMVDKAGDSIKEFNIRAKDGSEASKEAFTSLGLNADNMTKSFAQGGETARKAFDDVTTALLNIEDPIKQNQIGVSLFGTMWEDMEVKGMKALLNVDDAAKNAKGTIEKIDEVKYDSFSEFLTGIGRQLETVLLPATVEFYDKLMELSSLAFDNLKEINFGEIKTDAFNAITEALDNLLNGKLDVLVESLKNAGTVISETLGPAFQSIWETIQEMDWEPLLTSLDRIRDNIINNVVPAIQPLLAALGLLVAFLTGVLFGAIEGLIKMLPNVINAFLNVQTALSSILGIITGIFTGNWDLIKSSTIEFVTSVKNVIDSYFNAILDFITGFVSGIIGFFQNLYDVLVGHSIIPDMVKAILQWFTTMLNSGKAIVSTIVNTVINLFNSLKSRAIAIWSALKSGVVSVISAIKSFVVSGFNAMSSTAKTIASSIYNTVTSAFKRMASGINSALSTAKNFVSNCINSMKNTIKGLATGLYQSGRNAMSMFGKGISSMLGSLKEKAKAAANVVKDFLGFSSPTKEGPASNSDEWMPNMMQMFADTMVKAMPKVKNASKLVSENIQKVFKKTETSVDKLFQTIKDDIVEALEKAKKEATDELEDLYDITEEALKKQTNLKRKNALENLSKEKQEMIKEKQAKIDALNEIDRKEEEAAELAAYNKKLNDKELEMQEAETQEEKLKIKEEIDQLILDQIKKQEEEKRQAQIDALEEEIDNIENYSDAKEEEINNFYDAELENARTYEEAKRLIMQDSQDELLSLLQSYYPEWQNVGQSFADYFLNGWNSRKTAMQTNLESIVSSAKNIQNLDVNFNTSSLQASINKDIGTMQTNSNTWKTVDAQAKANSKKWEELQAKKEKSTSAKEKAAITKQQNELHKTNEALRSQLKQLEASNQAIGNSLGLTYSSKEGKWYLPNGELAWMADGGIVNSPTIVGVGEAGKEAILPLKELDGILYNSLSKLFNLDNSTTVNKTTTNNNYYDTNDNNRELIIKTPLYLDGEKIASNTSKIQLRRQQSKLRSLGIT